MGVAGGHVGYPSLFGGQVQRTYFIDPLVRFSDTSEPGTEFFNIHELVEIVWREDQKDGRGKKPVLFWKDSFDSQLCLYLCDELMIQYGIGYTKLVEETTFGPGNIVGVRSYAVLPAEQWEKRFGGSLKFQYQPRRV